MTTAHDPVSRRRRLLVVLALAVVACSGTATPSADGPTPRSPASPEAVAAAPTSAATDTGSRPQPRPAANPPAAAPDAAATPAPRTTTPVRILVESRVPDVRTDEFLATVADVLRDPRGWERAGFNFLLDGIGPAPYLLVLAEPEEVDALCLPLDTEAVWSCQNGGVVALNADRWRGATDAWEGTLEDYRTMLVNHEVGHLLHLHHPVPQCPALGLPAPVMAQQSAGAYPCTENPWPLQWEVGLAAEQREPLAPPATHDTRDHQPSPPPATE